MDPVTGYALASGVSALGQGLFGGGQKPATGNLHLVNPAQQGLYNMMAKQLMTGSGDFGFGTAFKQGKSQLQDLMAQRGIAPDSGVALQAMGNMGAQAVNQDAANRRNTWFQLMNQPLQTATSAGANFIPGSPSTGTSTDQQVNNYTNRENKYGRYASPWANYGGDG
jgi:hypothetical protein